MPSELRTFIYRSWLFFGVLAVLIILAVKAWPDSELILFQEDGVIEGATAIAGAVAAIIGFYAIQQKTAKNRATLDRLAIWTIPTLSTICTLDEISWGARIFHLQMPPMQGGGEFDGLHDIFVILLRLLAGAEPSIWLAVSVAAALLFAILVYWQQAFVTACLKYSVNTTLGRPLTSAILLLAFATLLDFGHGRIMSSLEEYAELSATLFLLAGSYYSLKMAHAAAPAKQAWARRDMLKKS